MEITLVIAYRDRELTRVRNCLESLNNQTNKLFQVILVDYGSDLTNAANVQKLCKTYNFVQYIYSDTRGLPWNRARALNIGIKISSTPFTMTTDVDLIFGYQFIAKVITLVAPEIELHSSAYKLPRKFTNYKKLLREKVTGFKQRPTTALGLSQTVSTEALKEIKGFDEQYTIYGMEDIDLNHRLSCYGLQTRWMNLSENPVYHQWHANFIHSEDRPIPGGWIEKLKQYFETNKQRLVRNQDGWGEVVETETRQALTLYHENTACNYSIDLQPVGVSANTLRIIDQMDMMSPGESLRIRFVDNQYKSFSDSTVYKFIRVMNSCNRNLGIPFKLTTELDYQRNYQDGYSIRDLLLNIQHDYPLRDFYLSFDKYKVECICIK